MKRCLVVDDSDVIRRVMSAILRRLGHQAIEAADGEGALACCRESMPDVILLDSNMPGMSGIEFLSALRGLGTARRPHIIYCTIENDPIELSRAFTCGIDDYLLKPFSRDMIEAKLAEVPVRTDAAA